jgi:hypothetical protein
MLCGLSVLGVVVLSLQPDPRRRCGARKKIETRRSQRSQRLTSGTVSERSGIKGRRLSHRPANHTRSPSGRVGQTSTARTITPEESAKDRFRTWRSIIQPSAMLCGLSALCVVVLSLQPDPRRRCGARKRIETRRSQRSQRLTSGTVSERSGMKVGGSRVDLTSTARTITPEESAKGRLRTWRSIVQPSAMLCGLSVLCVAVLSRSTRPVTSDAVCVAASVGRYVPELLYTSLANRRRCRRVLPVASASVPG